MKDEKTKLESLCRLFIWISKFQMNSALPHAVAMATPFPSQSMSTDSVTWGCLRAVKLNEPSDPGWVKDAFNYFMCKMLVHVLGIYINLLFLLIPLWCRFYFDVFRCVLERDPIAQKHMAKIQNLRGTYDSMGNRLPPPQPQRRSKSSSNLGKYLS